MNKDQLIDKIVNKTNYPKNKIKEFLEGTLNIIIDSLKKGERINLVGFGSFKVMTRKARKGINPRTGKKIRISDVKVVKFKTGKKLKEAVR